MHCISSVIDERALDGKVFEGYAFDAWNIFCMEVKTPAKVRKIMDRPYLYQISELEERLEGSFNFSAFYLIETEG